MTKTSILILVTMLACETLVATTWVETTDAADLPAGQVVEGLGTLLEIEGELGGRSPSFDAVDMFTVRIVDPAAFSATVSNAAYVSGHEPIDTQLFLFDESGFGVICNDDSVGILSALPAGHEFSPQEPGTYYLAIAVFDNDPISSHDDPDRSPRRIFPGDPPHIVEVGEGEGFYRTGGPTGPGGDGPIVGWDGAQIVAPHFAYTISLAGVEFARPPAPHVELRQVGADLSVILSTEFPVTAGELGLLYDPAVLLPASVTLGENLPSPGDDVEPLDVDLDPDNGCVEFPTQAGLTIGWTLSPDPGAPEAVVIPPGTHELVRIRFDCLAPAQPGHCSTIRLVGCLGPGEARIRNAVTDVAGNSISVEEPDPVSFCCLRNFVRGDSDSSGSIDLTDGLVTLNFLFTDGLSPGCMDAADTDDSGGLEISDAIVVFSYLFTGGSSPGAPVPSEPGYVAADCGPDPADDDELDCAVQSPVCNS